ncbi:MAG TPA: hypothetical protein VFN97_24960 [Actinospica sp.]|nr:hypothetical protein [Actinospica sp.]
MNESRRRIVAWTDAAPEASHAVAWATRHAEALGLPLRVLRSVAAPVGAAGAAGYAAPDPANLEPADVLVTDPDGYRRLGGSVVPVVVVPARSLGDAGGGRRVLLLAGSRLSARGADFAFGAAQDLRTALDVVRIAPQDVAFGEDYWIDAARSDYRTESRLELELSRLRARFPAVPGAFATLRTRPWATLRSMARSAQLIVLDRPDAALDPQRVLDLGGCPVVIVAEG